jgi:WD40 repeat protein
MSVLDIDTRSDIYSLGVLLYELLAGSTPFDAGALMSLGIDGIRKTIREKEPPRPSTRFATLMGEELSTAAQRRSTDTSKLMHELKGDLDWIVMKCLEKDRTRRYETANGLAADLKRHLNSEPVVARPPSAAYRWQKAFHRHKLVFSAGAAIGAALLLGIIATTWQSVRATQAQRAAQRAQANEALQRRTAEANERKAIEAQANEARLREQAQADELVARQRAYAADMNVAGQALAENNLGRAVDLLNRHRPSPGQNDLRGWEWRYLWQQTRSDASFTLCQQSSGILSLSASADGRWLAVGAQAKGGASVWDISARQRLVLLSENEEDVRVAFSPVATLLAYTSRLRADDGELHHTLHLWDSAARRMLVQVPLEVDSCNGLAFSSDGQRLVTSTFSGLTNQITLWSLPAVTKLASCFTGALSAGDMATDFATTADFRLAAFPTQDNRIQLLDLRDGRKLWEVPVTSGFVTALMFSPDGKTLATAEGFNESDILLWDVATGNEVGRLAGHGAWVNSVVFWPDGKTLASSSADQTLHVWDVASRTCLDVLRGHRFGVWRVVLLPDGKTLASGCKDGAVCIWDTSVRHPRQPRLTLPQQVVRWSFSTNSQSVQTFSAQGRVTRWSGAAFQHGETIMDLGTNYDPAFYFYPLFSEDGRSLANGSANGIIRVWDLANHTLLRAITNTTDIVTPVKFLAQGTRLLTGSKTGYTLHEWDLPSGREVQSWPERRGGEAVLADSQDENLFVTFVNGGSMQFWHLNIGGVSETNLNFLGAYAAAFSPNGRSFAVASTYGYARVWDSGSWRELATLGGFLSGVDSVAFSPDGLRLATGSGKQQALSLWDTTSWQNVLTLEGQGAGFVHSSFSPDGNALGSLNSDGDLHLWRAPSWAAINAAEAKEKMQFQRP